MFSSRSCIFSGLTFRSLICFEFIFVYGVRKCSSCILLKVVDQFSQHHLLKRLSFLHCIFLPPFSKIWYSVSVELSLDFLFCSIYLHFCLCASTILFWWLWLCSRAWSQAGWFLKFHSSFSRLHWLFERFQKEVRRLLTASLVIQTVKNLPAMQETWVWSLGQEDPLEKEMATHSSILA